MTTTKPRPYIPQYPPLRDEIASEVPAGQYRVLVAIHEHISTHGMPPTLRGIQDRLGFTSTNAVMCHIRPLARKGYVHQADRYASRNLLLTTRCFAEVLA